jgi:thiamine-phosphate pyrophosphorylase
MRPVICMITDRHRAGDDHAALIARIRSAAHAGVDIVQVRERDLEGRALAELVTGCVEAVRNTRTRVVVNERVDVALACGAQGVHLRGDSFAAARVRSMAPPGFLIGRSVHSAGDAKASGPVDYVMFGAVFETASKPGHPPASVGGLAAVVRATSIPVLAVGGVTADKASEVSRAAAAGIAAIGLFSDVAADALNDTVKRVESSWKASFEPR